MGPTCLCGHPQALEPEDSTPGSLKQLDRGSQPASMEEEAEALW
jgi:hypothetical protein